MLSQESIHQIERKLIHQYYIHEPSLLETDLGIYAYIIMNFHPCLL